ncbi:gluconokinase [Sphingomonas oligophenolica]
MSRNEIHPTAIVVMGVSGSGKSTLGALLAARLGCAFIEGDSFHAPASIAMMSAGQPLTDVERWPWLDRIGAALAAEVGAHGVAVAACSALKRSYRDRIVDSVPAETRFVFLDDDPDELRRRLAQRLGHYMPPSLLASQFATLERPAPDEAALTLRTQVPPEFLVREVLGWLAHPISTARQQRRQS